MKINFVGFYSQGGDMDKGNDFTAEKNIIEEHVKNEVDDYTFYTPTIIKQMGYSNHVVDFKDPGLVTANNKMNHIGNCAWRPLLLLLELNKLNDGDVVVYRDINCTKYPGLKHFKDFKKTIKKILEFENFDFAMFRQNETFTIEQHCKTNIINDIAINTDFTKNFPLLLSGYLIFKKTDVSIEFLQEWDRLCLIDKYINGEKYGELSPKFKWFTPEQGIMGVLVSNWVYNGKHNIPNKFPNFMWDENRNYIDYIIPKNYGYLELMNTVEGFSTVKHNNISFIVLFVLLILALFLHFNIYISIIITCFILYNTIEGIPAF